MIKTEDFLRNPIYSLARLLFISVRPRRPARSDGVVPISVKNRHPKANEMKFRECERLKRVDGGVNKNSVMKANEKEKYTDREGERERDGGRNPHTKARERSGGKTKRERNLNL